MKLYLYRSAVEIAQKSWFSYEPLTLLSRYKRFQRNFITLYSPFEYLLRNYRKVTMNQIFPITEDYIKEKQVTEENIALLKNSIELWRNAMQTTEAIAPILFHYSWHCFNSFFAYTFFRWKPQHSRSHGIFVSKLTDDIGKIEITIDQKNGVFQRVVDTWSCLGVSLVFSGYLPMFKDNGIVFVANKIPFLNESTCFNVTQLLNFDACKQERRYWKEFGRENLVFNPSINFYMAVPSRILQNYLILFVASSIARYRPILWSSIISGETEDKSAFALAYRKALLTYAEFGLNSHSFLNLITSFMNDLQKGRFELTRLQ